MTGETNDTVEEKRAEVERSCAKVTGQSCFHDRPLFMPATTYAPTHLARAVPSALRGLTSVFEMGTGGSPAVRSPTTCSRQSSVFSCQLKPRSTSQRRRQTFQRS